MIKYGIIHPSFKRQLIYTYTYAFRGRIELIIHTHTTATKRIYSKEFYSKGNIAVIVSP